jgi:hypothetical protein
LKNQKKILINVNMVLSVEIPHQAAGVAVMALSLLMFA